MDRSNDAKIERFEGWLAESREEFDRIND